MSETIVAVYENGVLRPLNPVSLSEGQTVQLTIVPQVSPGEPKNELQEVLQSLIDQGLLRLPSSKRGQVDKAELSRRQQARKLVKIPGKPLSETIIEARGAW
ncbi:antitoxin family protein [Microseira wollei]|uniref:DUF104 domain-containing protein n=1 Tax=Microseira wollei NIES-4236 TaxID=2530354 RepID=A0AAV3X959_9CYAN|nr:antitoxin family protein [Microseira wollei]GET38703.1 hypothetical protein MiSe_34620 [Microseira wollei NIES-4236]